MAGARISTDADGLEQQAVRREEAQLVHEEVARLPEVCRAAVVLCDLEGQGHEEAARQLRCSDRTLRRRLGRARDLLRARLTHRGLAPTTTAGVLAAALGPEPPSAAIPQITVDATARAAIRFAAGQAAVSTDSTLAEGVITAMFWTRLKGIAMASAVVLAWIPKEGKPANKTSRVRQHVGYFTIFTNLEYRRTSLCWFGTLHHARPSRHHPVIPRPVAIACDPARGSPHSSDRTRQRSATDCAPAAETSPRSPSPRW